MKFRDNKFILRNVIIGGLENCPKHHLNIKKGDKFLANWGRGDFLVEVLENTETRPIDKSRVIVKALKFPKDFTLTWEFINFNQTLEHFTLHIGWFRKT